MKRLFIILIMFASMSANAQWYWVNPYPTGNTVYCTKFVNAATGYSACASGTILKTTNGGINWNTTMLNNSSNLRTLHFINANTGLTAGDYGKLYRTTNGGNNWDNIFVNDSVDFRDIKFFDPNTGILVTGYNSGVYVYKPRIYKTTNGGLNWEVKHYHSDYWGLYSTEFATSSKLFVAGERCLYRSTNAGETWDTLSGYQFQRYSNRCVTFLDSLTGFVLSMYGSVTYCVSKTTDGGNTWSEYKIASFTISEPYQEIRSVSFLNSNTGIAVGWYSSIYRTENGGINWAKLPNTGDTSRHYLNVTAFGNNGFLNSGELGMIYRSTNNGRDFNKISRSFTNETLNWVSFINNQTGIVCGTNGAIFKTVNGGLNWSQQNCLNSANIIKAKLFNSDTGIAVSNNGRVYKTINGGDNWNLLFYDTIANWSTADFADSEFIRMTGGHCRHSGAYTTDGGLSWTYEWLECNCSGPPHTGCISYNSLTVADKNHQVISGVQSNAHSSSSAFVIATYNGINWNTLASTSPGVYLSSYVSYADTSNALVSFWQQGVGSMYRTNNGFRTTINITNPDMYTTYIALADSSNGIGFVYQRYNNGYQFKNSGIFKTTNGGQNWYLSGAISNDVEYLDYYKFNYAVAWGNGGALVANQNPGFIISINPVSNKIPDSYELFQNYPNPFNPVTKIKFELPNAGFVKLTVYDVTGREVETLVNERLAAGVYEASFEGSRFASGVYFYRMVTDGYSETKKMMLVR